MSIVGKLLARNINSPAHVQKIPFCKCPGECPLKNTEQNTWKKLVITLISKLELKILFICTKIDGPCGVETFKSNFMLFRLS